MDFHVEGWQAYVVMVLLFGTLLRGLYGWAMDIMGLLK